MAKRILTLSVVIVMTLALALTASANITIQGAPNWVNNDAQQGWRADGFEEADDGVISSGAGFTTADLQAAEALIIEVGEVPGYFQFTWQGDGDDFGWNEKAFNSDAIEAMTSGTTITLPLNADTIAKYDAFVASTQIKFLLAYYDGPWEDIFLSVTLAMPGGAPETTEAPAETEAPADTQAPAATQAVGGGAVESGDKEPDTGLGDVAVASAIALVAAGAVVFSRKKK